MIEHVSFTVSKADADACAVFYCLLGFELVDPPAGLGDRSIWLTRNGTAIHLMFAERGGAQVERTPPPGAGHVALVLDQYQATVNALTAAGVEVEPRNAYWGAPRAYLRDPAGNRVEIMAEAPRSRAAR